MTKAKKQTSARVSTMAARLLAKIPRRGLVQVYGPPLRSGGPDLGCRHYLGDLSTSELRAVLASALGQDETKGQPPKTPKRRARK